MHKIIYELKQLYLNISFYSMFVLFSIIGIPMLTLYIAFLALFVSRRTVMKRFRRAISFYGAVIIRALPFPFVRVRYRDHDRNGKEGPFIFISNHRSLSDAFLMACLPYECIQVVNIWPFRIPVLGMFARMAGYLSVREMPFEQFSDDAATLLNQGVSIIAFPEGTRSDGKEVGQFHGSMFRVALRTKSRIVPICITGNENVPPKGTLLLQPETIKIHKLPALHWEEYKDFSPFKLKNHVRNIIAEELEVMEGAGQWN
jgi:1-acyl-sn-glycerol-3-phosphate acyltransferase